MTTVKQQGHCGACWSFTAVGLVEALLVKTGKQSINIDLSEQHLLECTANSDCSGGYIESGLDKIK